MRILITGGAGYIGSHAVRLFLTREHDVYVYDNLSRGHRQAVPANRLITGDLSNSMLLEDTCRRHSIEAIVHFAGLTYVGESVTEPGLYYHNNVAGTLSLLEAARLTGIRRIVFSSTAAVYGTPQRVPIVETDVRAPINPYGDTKLTIEHMLAAYATAHGIGYAALRYFNAAGASPDALIGEDHQPETHLIPLVLQVALGQRPHIDIFGTDYPTPDGTCVRDYVHVHDLAEAHLLALEHIEPGQGNAYNLGIGRGYSVREVIELCREVTGRKITARDVPARAGDPASLVADATAATERLKWRPRYIELREIIETAWQWHHTHPLGYA